MKKMKMRFKANDVQLVTVKGNEVVVEFLCDPEAFGVYQDMCDLVMEANPQALNTLNISCDLDRIDM